VARLRDGSVGQGVRDERHEHAVERLANLSYRHAHLPRQPINSGRVGAEQNADEVDVDAHVERIDEVRPGGGHGSLQAAPQETGPGAILAQAKPAEPTARGERGVNERADGCEDVSPCKRDRAPAEREEQSDGRYAHERLDQALGDHVVAHDLGPAGGGEEHLEQSLQDHGGDQIEDRQPRALVHAAGRRHGDGDGNQAGDKAAGAKHEEQGIEERVRGGTAELHVLIQPLEQHPLGAEARCNGCRLDNRDGDREGTEKRGPEEAAGEKQHQQASSKSQGIAERRSPAAPQHQPASPAGNGSAFS